MVKVETKYGFNCEPDEREIHYRAITQPEILGKQSKEKEKVRQTLIKEKRERAFGSPSYKAYRFASESTLRLVDEWLEANGYPKINRSDFLNMDSYWDALQCIQMRSPVVSIPGISKRSWAVGEHNSAFCSVNVNGNVIEFQYIANQDTWKREHRDFRAALYVTTEGTVLCSIQDANQIKEAGF